MIPAEELRALTEGSVAGRVNRLAQAMWDTCRYAAMGEARETYVFARATTVVDPQLHEIEAALALFLRDAQRAKLRVVASWNNGAHVSWYPEALPP